MGAENVIKTGNITAANNQTTGVGNNNFNPALSQNIQYGRVTTVNPDRSIQYEIIQNSLQVSNLVNKTIVTGKALNFNPNFTRLPEIGEIVPLIKGPSKTVGSPSNQYDQSTYYILGPISVQMTVDDNKVPQNVPQPQQNDLLNYKLNELGING
jgi:hypothetical protein